MTQRLRSLTIRKTMPDRPFDSCNTVISLDGLLLCGVKNLTLEFDTDNLMPTAFIDILAPHGDRYIESLDNGFLEIFSNYTKGETVKISINGDELYGWENDRANGLSWAKLSFVVNLSIKDNDIELTDKDLLEPRETIAKVNLR